jgi:uncharacterized membrane protein
VPFISFGPFAFIPLILVGAALDYFAFGGGGTCTLVLGCIGLLFYIYSIVLSVLTLKTEKKAQDRAYEILRNRYYVTEEELSAIYEASKEIPVFFSANMSFGVALLVELAKKTAASMPDADIEIIETHHIRKIDAPSGTAKLLFDEIKTVRPSAFAVNGRVGHAKREQNEIGIHSLRMGNVVGIHEVIVATPNQTITLKHEAHSRALFAEGALCAAEFLIDCGTGLYDMKSIVSGVAAKDTAMSAN